MTVNKEPRPLVDRTVYWTLPCTRAPPWSRRRRTLSGEATPATSPTRRATCGKSPGILTFRLSKWRACKVTFRPWVPRLYRCQLLRNSVDSHKRPTTLYPVSRTGHAPEYCASPDPVLAASTPHAAQGVNAGALAAFCTRPGRWHLRRSLPGPWRSQETDGPGPRDRCPVPVRPSPQSKPC